jgi:hypothetical protein
MIRNYNNFLLEMAISDDKAKKYDTVLRELSNIKKTKLYVDELILELKNEFSNISKIKFIEDEENINKLYLTTKYNANIDDIIRKLKNILDESEDFSENYFKNIYPDGVEKDFYVEIKIEKNNLNRIHIPLGLPYILKGIGLGKKIYISLIKKYKYLSSNYLDRSMESIYVWNSIRKEKDIYTFIFNEKILSLSNNIDFEEAENLLVEFFKNIIDEHIILDDDFKDKYIKQIISSKKIRDIYEYELNQEK